jgi:hypothetical protein
MEVGLKFEACSKLYWRPDFGSIQQSPVCSMMAIKIICASFLEIYWGFYRPHIINHRTQANIHRLSLFSNFNFDKQFLPFSWRLPLLSFLFTFVVRLIYWCPRSSYYFCSVIRDFYKQLPISYLRLDPFIIYLFSCFQLQCSSSIMFIDFLSPQPCWQSRASKLSHC